MLCYCIDALSADGSTRHRIIVRNVRNIDHALELAATARGYKTRTTIARRVPFNACAAGCGRTVSKYDTCTVDRIAEAFLCSACRGRVLQ